MKKHITLVCGILFCSFVFGDSTNSTVPAPIHIAETIAPQLGVDEYRKAMTQKEIALTLVRLGRWDEAEGVMSSINHYLAPTTIAEAILLGWDRLPAATTRKWFDLADQKMDLTIGRDSVEPTNELGFLWMTYVSMPGIHAEQVGTPPRFFANLSVKLAESYRTLLGSSLWSRLMDRLFPSHAWDELSTSATKEEKKAWKEGRTINAFVGRILMAEARRRVVAGTGYPSSWLSFVIGGMDATGISSDPARLAVDSYRLAVAENKNSVAAELAKRIRIMLPQSSPTAFGAYEAGMVAALACGSDGPGRDELSAALQDLHARAEKHLMEYEKMMVYPQLGAGFVALGKTDFGNPLFQQVMTFADKNRDPESKRIGVIRLELGLALASMSQTPEEYKKIVKILADADKG